MRVRTGRSGCGPSNPTTCPLWALGEVRARWPVRGVVVRLLGGGTWCLEEEGERDFTIETHSSRGDKVDLLLVLPIWSVGYDNNVRRSPVVESARLSICNPYDL